MLLPTSCLPYPNKANASSPVEVMVKFSIHRNITDIQIHDLPLSDLMAPDRVAHGANCLRSGPVFNPTGCNTSQDASCPVGALGSFITNYTNMSALTFESPEMTLFGPDSIMGRSVEFSWITGLSDFSRFLLRLLVPSPSSSILTLELNVLWPSLAPVPFLSSQRRCVLQQHWPSCLLGDWLH